MTRDTRRGRLILEIVRESHAHPTADEIFALAQKSLPGISRSTVYRNLGLLADAGLLRRLRPDGGPDHFDAMTEGHYHFRCRNCRSVTNAALPYCAELDAPLEGMPGYKIEGHMLTLEGLCPACADR